jgi:excisionase family DNA binding protein
MLATADLSEQYISSSQAASILGVHESSIKRWCNAGRLPVSRTGGGHRRIDFADLLSFVAAEDMDCSLTAFSPNEYAVWHATEMAQLGDYSELADLYFELLRGADVDGQANLLSYSIDRGASMVDVFEYVFASALHQIGRYWESTIIETGDEHHMSAQIRDAIELVRLRFRKNGDRLGGSLLDSAQQCAIVGCPAGEAHVLGALMIRALLEWRGWRVVFLGADTPTEDFVKQRAKFDASLVCISVVPPLEMASAARTLESLRLLDPDAGYDVVLGGGSRPRDLTPLYERAGRHVEWFDSLHGFLRWVNDRA